MMKTLMLIAGLWLVTGLMSAEPISGFDEACTGDVVCYNWGYDCEPNPTSVDCLDLEHNCADV